MIGPESPSHAAAIASLATAAFLNAPHTLHTETFTVNALRCAGAMSVSLVAEDDGGLVGHVPTLPVLVSDGETAGMGRDRFRCRWSLQGQGIGSALMHSVLRAGGRNGLLPAPGFSPQAAAGVPGHSA